MEWTDRKKEYHHKYYEEHKKSVLERTRKYYHDNIKKIKIYEGKRRINHNVQKRLGFIKLKKIVFEHYGNKCICCGGTTFEFLSIDHKNRDGYKHRKELKNKYGNMNIYRWLIKNNFPKDNFQILCFNCNLARGFYGKCPHEVIKNE